jgi:hypothetical protein
MREDWPAVAHCKLTFDLGSDFEIDMMKRSDVACSRTTSRIARVGRLCSAQSLAESLLMPSLQS